MALVAAMVAVISALDWSTITRSLLLEIRVMLSLLAQEPDDRGLLEGILLEQWSISTEWVRGFDTGILCGANSLWSL